MVRSKALTIIIPVFNEEENIPLLVPKLVDTLKALKKSYEVILVDDGSTDDSWRQLKTAQKRYSHLVIMRLRRNFGQTAAIRAGIEKSKGSILVFMDADGQNDPADIPKLLAALQDDIDIVSGFRKNRQDPWLTRKIPSFLANKIISAVTGIRLKDYGCTLKAYRREALAGVSLYGEMHRFLPALCAWQGAKISEIPVSHHPRKYGHSKYGLWRTFKVLLDLVTVKFLDSYMTKPIYIFGGLGLVLLCGGLLVVGFLTYEKLTVPGFFFITSPLLLLSVLLEILGVMFVVLGLLAEISVRIYYESQGKKPYSIKNIF